MGIRHVKQREINPQWLERVDVLACHTMSVLLVRKIIAGNSPTKDYPHRVIILLCDACNCTVNMVSHEAGYSV